MESHLRNIEGMIWVRQWSVYAKTRSWKYDKEEDIYMDSKDLPANHFLITKEKDNNFTMEKPYNHLNQLSKTNINIETNY